MSDEFTTDVTQWQGVDDEPTAGSDNLVKSGGVAAALGSLQVLTSASSVHNGYDTSGNPQGTLNTYFYPVSEGDVLKINYNVFSSGFSVVQAWNDNTFVASVLNSPLTGEGSIFYKVPAGVNKVGCTYFQNNVYLYVPTLTFDDKPKENSHKLLDSGAIFKSSVFCGSIGSATPNLINSFDLQQGLWYVSSNNPNMPFTHISFVHNQGIEGLKQQIAINLVSAEIYIRVSNNLSWGNWKKVNYSYYKRSLVPADNIDTLYDEGVYYLTLTEGGNNTPQGTLPFIGDRTGLLEVQGTGSISKQILHILETNRFYTRSGSGSYSNWSLIPKEADLSSYAAKELTRNRWVFADNNISYDSYVIIGNGTTKLFSAGIYRFSFTLNVENSNRGVNLIAYYVGGGSIDILYRQGNTPRKTVTFSATGDIGQIFFTFDSAQEGNTASFTDIQLEEILNWNGYTSSPQKGDWAPLPYATPYVDPTSPRDLISREALSYWNGKTINYNGDSVTQGITSDRIGWVRVVNQMLKFGKVNNYAIGGTCLAHVDGIPNSMVDRYTDMSLDCDILMIMANTNDYASQVSIGNVDSVNPNEYNGALNIIFSWIKANFKTQPIIISTMLTRKVNYDGQGNPLPITIEQYAEAVRERTAAYGFILYDAYKLSGLDLLNSVRDGSGITDDGLHPNEAGALALGRKIAAFINAQ
jgi:lysophospholipase L1-like esterase